jgi:hypothetical protein
MHARATDLTALAERPYTNPVLRHVAFLLLTTATAACFWRPLSSVLALSLQYGRYEHFSHIVLIPIMSLFLVYRCRQAVFERVAYDPLGALPFR